MAPTNLSLSHLSFSFLLFTLVFSSMSQISVGTPSISVDSPPIDVSTPPISVSTPPISDTTPIPGGMGDPHYNGADGSHFDFSGEPNTTYCLISDEHFHVNVFYGGRYDHGGDKPSKSLTWIRKIAVLWGHNTISFIARQGSRWQYDDGYMSRMEVNGIEFKIPNVKETSDHAGGAIQIQWLAAKVKSADDLIDIYELRIADSLRLRLKLRPEIELLRTADDGVVHFDFELPIAGVSNGVHGILGQTFRRDHLDRLPKQHLEFSDRLNTYVVPGDNGEGFLDGRVDDYRCSGLLIPDCTFTRFTFSSTQRLEQSNTIELRTTGGKSVIGVDNSVGRRMGPI